MQKVISIIAFLTVALVHIGLSQNNAVDRYYEEYRFDEQYTHVSVSSKMFDLFVNFEREDPAEQQLIETISKLDGMKVLIGKQLKDAHGEFQRLSSEPYRDMEELMDITESGKEFKFFIRENGGNIDELLMVGYEGSNVFVLSLIGDIDLKEIAKLSKKMDIDGFEHFENIDQ